MTLQPSRRLSASQAAEYLGLKESTLAKWRMRRLGPVYVRCGPRVIQYEVSALDGFIAASRNHPEKASSHACDARAAPVPELKSDKPVSSADRLPTRIRTGEHRELRVSLKDAKGFRILLLQEWVSGKNPAKFVRGKSSVSLPVTEVQSLVEAILEVTKGLNISGRDQVR